MSKRGSGHADKRRGFRGVPAERMREIGVSRVAAGVAAPTSPPSIDAIRAHIDAQTCPFCGAGPFKMLPVHTNKAHGVDKWELRDLAGLSVTDPLCSAEAREAMSAAYDVERGAEVRAKATAASKTRRRPRRTVAGRQRNIDSLKQWEAENPDVVPERRTRALAAAHSVDATAKRVETLKAAFAADPRRLETLQRNSRTPEAQAKRAATLAQKPPPDHGTVARYKRGCRCVPCRDAKRVYRAGRF